MDHFTLEDELPIIEVLGVKGPDLCNLQICHLVKQIWSLYCF